VVHRISFVRIKPHLGILNWSYEKNFVLTAALGLSLLTACEEDSGRSPGNNNNAGMLPAGVSG